jgi:hypothetical protein
MWADAVFLLSLCGMLSASLYGRPRIQADRIAMQWRLDGKPTWHAPRAAALWGPPVFALAVRGFIDAAMTLAPDKVHRPDIGLVLFSIVAAGVHIFTLARAR